MKQNFRDLIPVLYTADVVKSIDFYKTILGFELQVYNQALGWASLKKDNVEIMLSRPNEHVPFERPIMTGSIYITCHEDIDGLWQDLRNKAEVCYPIETFEYGMREFAIYDCNGYVLQFGQLASTL